MYENENISNLHKHEYLFVLFIVPETLQIKTFFINK